MSKRAGYGYGYFWDTQVGTKDNDCLCLADCCHLLFKVDSVLLHVAHCLA